MGRDLVLRKAEARWGAGIVEQVSLDLQDEFPGEQGLSASSLWAMKRWYLFYAASPQAQKLEQAVQVLLSADNVGITKLEQVGQVISETPTEGLPFPLVFAFLPWGHHVEIVKKCKSIDEALYYITRTIQGDWSRHYLMERIKEGDYKSRGGILPNNFDAHLPQPQSLLAKEIMHENIDLGFIALPQRYTERQLEDALCQQMTRFLLELGTGFAFVGRQKEIVVAGKSRAIDLLFYHIRLR